MLPNKDDYKGCRAPRQLRTEGHANDEALAAMAPLRIGSVIQDGKVC